MKIKYCDRKLRLASSYFPSHTIDTLKIAEILRFGILPIGSRNKWSWKGEQSTLNIGFITNTPQLRIQLENLVPRFQSLKFTNLDLYPIEITDYVEVVKNVYSIPNILLHSLPKEKIHVEVLKHLDELEHSHRKDVQELKELFKSLVK